MERGSGPVKEGLHSSLQPDSQIQEYIGDRCKYYYLPLYRKTLFPEVLDRLFGASNFEDRSLDGILASLVKAQKGRYSHIKIPMDRLNSKEFQFIRERAPEMGLGIVIQICTSFLYDEKFFKGLAQVPASVEVEWVLDNCHHKVESRLIDLTQYFDKCHLSVGVHKNVNWGEILKTPVMRIFPKVHVYLGYQHLPSDEFLNCKQSHRVVGMLRKFFPGIVFLPPRGVDLWDHRAQHDFDMEPFIQPCFETQSKKPDIKYSVIIPTYNNEKYIQVVLRHLVRQNVGLDSFEVIVVDDGSSDQTQVRLIDIVLSLSQSMNFKYIFFPRTRKRVMGDSQYRAGIARNLGVKNAVGEILSFLDSDIVVPENYLEGVGLGLEKWDALQARRVNLSESASQLSFEYNQISEARDIIPDEDYWEEFIKIENWDELPYNWKYVCTHSFSLKKELFWKIGGLKKNFIYYGFEDTDLGYRLVKGGYCLHLLDIKVFHMFHEPSRSEFLKLNSLRHSLLSRTAQIFYLHNLDEDIYENLLGFMEPEPTFNRILGRLIETMSLQFLWKPTPPVYKTMRKNRWLES